MLNRKSLLNNISLAVNVSDLQDSLGGGTALVLSEGLKVNYSNDIFKINDFFDVIIVSSVEALESVPFADFQIYDSNSPYKDSKLWIEEFFSEDTILVTNFQAIKKIKKMSGRVKTFNINYLPSREPVSSVPSVVKGISCGLNSELAGNHLANILGCSRIFTDPSDLGEFLTKPKDGMVFVPENIVTPNRKSYSKVFL